MTNTNTVLRRDLKQRQVACVTRLYVRLDSHGTPRTGPRRAWWMDLRPRVCNGIGISYEIPRSRMYAWNAAGVAYVAVAVFVAHLVGHLAASLAAVGVMVAAAGVVLVAIANAHQPQASPAALPDEVVEEHRKVAAFLAARHRERICESCQQLPATCRVRVQGRTFYVCDGCASVAVAA